MPTPTKYTYSVSADFPGGVANIDRLSAEITASSIATALQHIDRASDILDVWFVDTLSSGDETTLDGDVVAPAGGLIASHDNSAQKADRHLATTNPGLTADSSEGFSVGDQWINTDTATVFVCSDSAEGAAAWVALHRVDEQEVTSTSKASTTSTSLVDMPGMSLLAKQPGTSTYKLCFIGEFLNSGASKVTGKLEFSVGGSGVASTLRSFALPVRDNTVVNVSAKVTGVSFNDAIKVRWCVDAGSVGSQNRTLEVSGVPEAAII